jgi:hypothetical protein
LVYACVGDNAINHGDIAARRLAAQTLE